MKANKLLVCFLSLLNLDIFSAELFLSKNEDNGDFLIALPCGHRIEHEHTLNKYCPHDDCPKIIRGISFAHAVKEYLSKAIVVEQKTKKQLKPCFTCVKEWDYYRMYGCIPSDHIEPYKGMSLEMMHPLFLKKVNFYYYEWRKDSFINEEWLEMDLYFDDDPRFGGEQIEELKKYGHLYISKREKEPKYNFTTGTPNDIGFHKKDQWITCFRFGLNFLHKYSGLPHGEEIILKDLFRKITKEEL